MKKLNRFLLLIEGPDFSGKSKLCCHLIEKYRFNYYHCGVKKDIKEYHNNVLTLVLQDVTKQESNFVIDRLDWSEYVYGNIFRNGPQYDWKKFDTKIKELCKDENITFLRVLCLPPKNIVIDGHSKRNANGDEMFNTVDKVYDSYNQLYEENKDLENLYKYDFTIDSDYANFDMYLESL